MPAIIRWKLIYGLHHARATLRRHSDAALRSLGFTPIVFNPRLYVRLHAGGSKVYISVHIDGFGIAASNKALMKEVVAKIKINY